VVAGWRFLPFYEKTDEEGIISLEFCVRVSVGLGVFLHFPVVRF
jgi:hypothetical protein